MIRKDMTLDEVVAIAKDRPYGKPSGWQNWPVVINAYRRILDDELASDHDYPDGFAGRGIVICAGGSRLFTNGYVCIRMLRNLGCSLPIEMWYLGKSEVDDDMREIVAPHDVTCVDARIVEQSFPARILCGFEIKPFAIIRSSFEEVLLLDADNIPCVDPEFLLSTEQYQEHGAIFWPDFGRLGRDRVAWSAAGIDYRDEPEIESGQIVVNKKSCWKELCLTKHLNDHSDFWYRHVHGDKETFHLAWRKCGREYAMPARGIDGLDSTMCQHDFDGRRIFQHRNMDKWQLDGKNKVVQGFLFEEQCRKFLGELRNIWSGTPWKPKIIAEVLAQFAGTYLYHRIGHDYRYMQLKPDGSIGDGSAACERNWFIDKAGRLAITGDKGLICLLKNEDGVFRGNWEQFERMPIELKRA